MKNKRIIAIISAIIVLVGVFAACNQHTETVTETTAPVVTNVVVRPSETSVEDTESKILTTRADTTTSEAKPVREKEGSKEDESTTHKATTTTKKTTAATTKETTSHKQKTKPSTTKATTKKKETTTKKKETTTKKKETTTKAKTCTNSSNHSMSCGNMGRWFSSRSEVKAYVDKEMKYWADLEERGEITREEYYKKCPSGYECWSCAYCGKWTGNFKY